MPKEKYCPGHIMLKTFVKCKIQFGGKLYIPTASILELLFSDKIRGGRWATLGFPQC